MRWFWNWVRRNMNNEQDIVECRPKYGNTRGETGSSEISFTIIPAEGGFLLQHYSYDHKNDRSTQHLKIIHEDADVAEEVGNHVKIELMRL